MALYKYVYDYDYDYEAHKVNVYTCTHRVNSCIDIVPIYA